MDEGAAGGPGDPARVRTPAGKTVLIDDGQRAQSFNLSSGGRMVTHSLAVGSVATYVW